MSDIEQASLEYYAARTCEGQWKGFLRALAGELDEQMPAEELRAFFRMVGGRMAAAAPLAAGQTLQDLEVQANRYFGGIGWGWMKVRDLDTSLELLHSCSPLRQAFGDGAMSWTTSVLEGLYAGWLRQLGAGEDLQFRQVGRAEGGCDTLRFRLAHPSQFV